MSPSGHPSSSLFLYFAASYNNTCIIFTIADAEAIPNAAAAAAGGTLAGLLVAVGVAVVVVVLVVLGCRWRRKG